MLRKIAFVTGTRADYGLMRSTIKAIDSHPELELCLIVTGMHLLYEFGYTINYIKKDGFPISAELDILLSGDSKAAMATSTGLGIIKISQALEQIKPDIVLIEGDRWEALSAAVASAIMNIPIAHVSGGDVTEGGCIDDSIRHAITKLAHIHFPGTKKSAERILKMGEESWRIYEVGDPGNDLLDFKPVDMQELKNRFDLNICEPILLVIQHSVSSEIEPAIDQIRETMEAIVELGLQTIVIYPNSDAGGRSMIKVIKEYSNFQNIKIFRSLTRDEYLNVMAVSSVIIGNSSSGIVESPFFKIPVVNIGTRQQGRERSSNVIDVGYNKGEIISAIKKAIFDEDFKNIVKNCPNPYASKNTGAKIAKSLCDIKIDEKLLRKKLSY